VIAPIIPLEPAARIREENLAPLSP
jgi:hypothetical protein